MYKAIIGSAVEKSLNDPNAEIWLINQQSYDEVKNRVSEKFETPDGYIVEIKAPTLTTGLISFNYIGMNSLGMNVKLRAPLYLRVLGEANLVIESPNGNKAESKIDVEVVIPYARPFLMEQYARFQYDMREEGFVTKILKYIGQRIINDGLEPNEENIKKSLEIAISVEEATLYRNLANKDIENYIRNEKIIDPYCIYNPSSSKSLKIDLSNFEKGFEFFENNLRLTNTSRVFDVEHQWAQEPKIKIEKRAYSGREAGNNAIIYDISVNGILNLVSWDIDTEKAKFEGNITVSSCFRLVDFNAITDPNLPQVEDRELFEEQFAFPSHGLGDIEINIVNVNGIQFDKFDYKTAEAELYLDGTPIGIFSPSIINLKNIEKGLHAIEVIIVYPNGTMEHGNTTINIGKDKVIKIETDNGVGTTLFWTIVMAYTSSIERQYRISKLCEVFAGIVGYPFPNELKVININSEESIVSFIDWSDKFYQFITNKSKSFRLGYSYQAYALQTAIADAVNIWKNFAKLMLETKRKYGFESYSASLLNFVFEEVSLDFPAIGSMSELLDVFLPILETSELPSLIESGERVDELEPMEIYYGLDLADIQERFELLDAYFNVSPKDKKQIEILYGTLKNDSWSVILAIAWLFYAKYTNLSDYLGSLVSNVSYWSSKLKPLFDFMDKIGIKKEDRIYYVAAIALAGLAGYAIVKALNWTQYFENLIKFYDSCSKVIKEIANNLKRLDIKTGYGFAAIVLAKFLFNRNITWFDYLNNISNLTSQILPLKKNIENLGINSSYGWIALV
ncbi:MAG: hypothetical protein AB1779_10730, partial [Candidatus Thermoplasmatota archaeon]